MTTTSKARFSVRLGFFMAMGDDGAAVLVAKPRETGRELPCPGEAHSNAHIDHCGLCAPRWGIVKEAVLDVDAALDAGLAVSVNDVPDARAHEMLKDREHFALAWVTQKTGYGSCNFGVFVRKAAQS